MEVTTHLELHSQTTRLFESILQIHWGVHVKDGILTLYDASFQKTYTWSSVSNTSLDYNSGSEPLPDFKFELFPLHSQLLGESLLVSFPPLIDMLKFSG
jgi:hypothetical protein